MGTMANSFRPFLLEDIYSVAYLVVNMQNDRNSLMCDGKRELEKEVVFTSAQLVTHDLK